VAADRMAKPGQRDKRVKPGIIGGRDAVEELPDRAAGEKAGQS
jgi:hypothetical protein